MAGVGEILIEPVISEKSYDLVAMRKYTFKVDTKATKPEIKRAVEEMFGVTVTSVNTIKVTGKKRRQGWTSGRRPDRKKAVVTLAEGETIEIFEATS